MTNKIRKHAIKFTQPSLTKQSFKNETNINNIMQKYETTGELPVINQRKPQYGDFTNIGTYQEAQNQIMLAQKMFYDLPANIRKNFNNNPVSFVEYCSNPDNHDNLVKMGLAEAKDISPADGVAEANKDNPTPPKEEKTSPARSEESSGDT